jgi:hypothetical protein
MRYSRSQFANVNLTAFPRHYIRHQFGPPGSILIVEALNNAMLNLLIAAKSGFDFSKMHTKTTHFNLVVGSSKGFQYTVSPSAAEIAGAIDTFFSTIRQANRHKSFGIQVWALPVTVS